MPTVKKTSQAERDICEVLLYVGSEDRSPTGAVCLADAFDKAFALYAANPLLRSLRPEFGENVRIFSCGTKFNPHGWVVFYLPKPDGIIVMRVFRSEQNYTELF